MHLIDVLKGKTTLSVKRSKDWHKVRNLFLKKNNKCHVCSGTKKLEVHHIKPFNTHPELELNTSNLITLCESKKNGVNCHLFIGHLGSYRDININVIEDAKIWKEKLSRRKTARRQKK